jgi:hypothetical protein
VTGPERPAARVTPQVVVGVAIIVWGLLLTGSNLGWLPSDLARHLIRFWPLAIVVLGAAKIVSATSRSSQVFGGILVLVGGWITAEQVYGIRVHFWQWWPLLLVAGGVMLIVRAWEGRAAAPEIAGDGGAEIAFWSGVERRVSSPDFRRADLTAVMGGIELDLRGASTATGTAVVDVFALMGGIEITVPTDWVVVNQIMPILGGVEDKSTGTQASQHRLILRGFVLMGGVEIKT